MANPTIFPGDLVSPGQISANTLFSSNAFLTDTMVVNNTGAGGGIKASKLQVQKIAQYSNSDAATTSVTEQRCIHVVNGQTATVVAIQAGAVVANVGAATVTVDLLKNGSSILTAAITLNNSQAAYALVSATIASANLTVGQVLEIKTVATAGGGTIAKGCFAYVVIREDAQ